MYNEAANVEPLVESLTRALREFPGTVEIILVDDGSSDDTWDRIERAARELRLRGVRLGCNVGQTAALMAGFDLARGAVVVAMDGDLQNDPEDIPALVAMLEGEGYDLVCGWRLGRRDDLIRRKVPSWCANRLIQWVTGVPIRDNGCSLKAYRRELIQRLSLYSDQHRFIPALAASFGSRIGQMPVRHHARRFGQSKYGLSRTTKVLVDLVTLKMVTTFRTRPLLGFGLLIVPAAALAAASAVLWIAALTQFGPDKSGALVFPAVTMLWIGLTLYLLMLGLIAEVVVSTELDTAQRTPTAWEIS
jgi:glycosyltransferase involved in cell wall biosynthesis